MANYKNSELYQLAFTLAIKIYKLNVMLPLSGLLHQGNRLRWMSLQIKNLISENYAPRVEQKKQLHNFNQVEKLIQDMLIQLKKIGAANAKARQIQGIMSEYMKLMKKVAEERKAEQPKQNEYIIPFNESRVMDMAG